MKTIKLERVELQPSDEEFRLYPDFLVNHLIRLSIGVIEAGRASGDAGRVNFVFVSHQTSESKVVGSIGAGFFRPLLGRLGPRFGAEDMLYMGHTLFACEAQCDGQIRLHRFSLFVCNEPTMAVWMKLYFYCIDGIWPVREEAK